jgi:putative ABC transport system permease protein
MTLLHRVAAGLLGLVRKTRVERELDEELRAYVDAAVEAKVAAGMSRAEALRAVRRDTGSIEAVKDRVRDAGWESIVEGVWQDARFAIRIAARERAFTSAVVATLALGIGGTTAIFSVVDGLFLRAPDGVQAPASLRNLFVVRDEGSIQTPYGRWTDYNAMRGHSQAFVSVGAYMAPELVDLGRGVEATQVRAVVASHDFLATLGIQPTLGRGFLPEEDTPGSNNSVALISHAMWQSRFGGATDALGKTLLLNARPVQIVGITPRGFAGIGADEVDVWLPASMAEPVGIVGPSDRPRDWRETLFGANFVGRLAPGAQESNATAILMSALRAAQTEPSYDPTPVVRASPLVLAAGPGHTLLPNLSLWLALAAGIVLIIACANVANLLLARAITRRRELAVRLSIGASAWRVARQHLTESAVLAVLGGTAGILLASWAMNLMRQFPLPSSAGRIDGRLLFFTLAVSLLTGLLFGVFPAMRAAAIDPLAALKDAPAVGALTRNRTRRTLLVLQVSLSVALLIGAGLIVRSLRQVTQISGGVDLNRLAVVTIDLKRSGYTPEAQQELYEAAISRLSTIPGVERATFNHYLPFAGWGFAMPWSRPGESTFQRTIAYLNLAGPGYFETVGTRVLAGRSIKPEDTRNSEPIAVVNETMARLIAPDGNALGLCVPLNRQVRAGGCTNIVGISETQRFHYLTNEPVPMVFRPWRQIPNAVPYGTPSLLVRTAGDPTAHVPAIRAAVQGLRADLPFVTVEPLTATLEPQVLPYRLGATLFSIFGLLALTLAAIGVYGVLGYFVAERRVEIGIRRALGAPAANVIALVLRQGLIPTVAGLLLGIAAAAATTRYLASLLFGIEARDPVSFSAAAAFLLTVAVAAMLLPAWRAAQIDPITALRQD